MTIAAFILPSHSYVFICIKLCFIKLFFIIFNDFLLFIMYAVFVI